jgi:hypothetical protein
MEAWDQEYINMEVPGHFTSKKEGTGHFQFGLVQGEMDCRMETDPGVGKVRIRKGLMPKKTEKRPGKGEIIL